MISEREFPEVRKDSVQTETEKLSQKTLHENILSYESDKIKIEKINNELSRVEQHIYELKNQAHCFQNGDIQYQIEILINSEISKHEHTKFELELQRNELLNLKGHRDQMDLLQHKLNILSQEEELLNNYSKANLQQKTQEELLEREENKLLHFIQNFSGVLEKIIPELENFQFKLQKTIHIIDDTQLALHGKSSSESMQDHCCRTCHRKTCKKEATPCKYDKWRRMLSNMDAEVSEHLVNAAEQTDCCLKHGHEERKISLEIKQERAKAKRELQIALCQKEKNRCNYEKARSMMLRVEEAMTVYYQYFNQGETALHLRDGTCRQFSDTIIKKGYEVLKEQCQRSQQHTVQLDKDLTVHFEEVMVAHHVIELLEKHALNYFERQDLLHSKGFSQLEKIILLHELIDYVEKDRQRLCYFLKEVTDSKKKMAAMAVAMDNIEEQARSLKNNDNERIKAELMKVVKQMQYAKCLDCCRTLKDCEHLLSCMSEKMSLKPSQLDLLRLKGEVESILNKCQDWSEREETLYREQLEELEVQAEFQNEHFSEKQSAGAFNKAHKTLSDELEKEIIKETADQTTEMKEEAGNNQNTINAKCDTKCSSQKDGACVLELAA